MHRSLLPILAGLTLFAGCGGDSSSSSGEDSSPLTNATTGKAIFVDAACSSCHRLADADAEGITGPDLDKRRPDADESADQIRSGGGGMPAYEGRLTDAQIETLANHIAESAGR